MESEITAVLVIEVLGRPAEHVASALEQLVERLGKESEIQVVNKKFYKPKESEKTKGMFFAFAEIEIKTSTITRLAEICFSYMPSSVEIVHPYELKMTLNDANAILNLLVARLHNYDAIAKSLTIENTILQNQLRQAGIIRQQIPQDIKAKPAKQKPKAKKKAARKGKGK
ncbi:hypothetical protein J4433_00610 [Candidatus Pacearchaeota archaeon]|nr:hypothetical protein [Candidatus Pacearchaeota archaeon]